VAAADLAVRDAGLICTDLDELGSAVNTAVVDGQFDLKMWGHTGMNNLTPLWLLKYLPNMLSCHVTIVHGAEGPSNCITCGAASGVLSAQEGARWIQRGAADVVIAGGAESKVNPMVLMRQTLLKRVCTTGGADPAGAVRPFDAGHAGTAMGEGGGLAILEDLGRAQHRGARIYAELAGFGAACDGEAIDVTHPTTGRLDAAVTRALHDAGITADQVDLIVAHGTGVPAEDELESAAWETALGDRAAEIPAFAITGGVGSLFAGAGGAELAAAVLAVHDQTVPPTVNFSEAAGGCRLNLSNQPREAEIRYAVCGGFSFAGQSAACVVKRTTP